MPWCPYTDLVLPDDAVNSEHIIPLSLGGANDFCIPVEKQFNAQAGTKIDGALANDFLTLIRRREFDARGHSNTPPTAVLRKSVLEDGKRPIQVTLRGKDDPLIWDAKSNRYLQKHETAGKRISSQFKIGMYDRKRFLAKVALSSGYFIYGEIFRNCVRHSELRALMNLSTLESPNDFKDFELRGYDEFSPIANVDKQQKEMDTFFCQLIKGSCVIAIPGPQNVGFVVGILGKWVGTLNVPATTDSFPFDDEYDLGHVIALRDGKMIRMSYRQLAKDAYELLENRKNG
jgi:hypothetical protein